MTANTVKQFENVIGYWTREKIVQAKVWGYLTSMLDESTDKSNRSELSLIFRIVNSGVIENHFLDLMQLQRCDTETIFKACVRYFLPNFYFFPQMIGLQKLLKTYLFHLKSSFRS